MSMFINDEKQKQAKGENIFNDLSDGKYYVNSPCFLTVPERTIKLNGLYLKAEGHHFDAIKILHVHYESQFIYLMVEDINTGRIYKISHIVDENSPCIWWLQDWEFVENDFFKKVSSQLSDSDLLEFDF